MSTQIARIIDEQRDQFLAVASTTGIEFEREKGFALQILGANDYLAKIAMNNPDSLRAAVTNISAIGISLNPASKQAYLVPRDGKVCLDLSYMGLMHIAQQTGAIKWGQAVLVYEKDIFNLGVPGTMPEHRYNAFATDEERGKVIGCYVVVKTDTDDFLTEAMPISKIYDIRDRSSAWKAWLAKKTKCPWVTDEGEMIKKTVIKRASKMWPHRERLDAATHYLNTDGGEGIPLSGGAEPKDITPASADQQIAVTDTLREMGKEFSALAPFFQAKYKSVPESIADLTSAQAVAVLAFIQKRAA